MIGWNVRVDDQCARRGRSTPDRYGAQGAAVACGSMINAQGAAAATGRCSVRKARLQRGSIFSAQGAAALQVSM
eukprot:1144397-Heterocapsa_arctica.AAC.1